MQTQKILEELIAIDSQCSKSNKEIINYLQTKLSRFIINRHSFEHNGLDLHNLVVRISGEQSQNPLVFVGHTDTVVASSEWTTDPLKPFVEEEKLYGLGASDMKAGLACMISAALNLSKKPRQDVYLLFDADEEDGGSGGLELVKSFDVSNARTIVAEPTDGNIIYAQKGCLDMKFIFKGFAKHSSRADLDYCLKNGAIYKALTFFNQLNKYALDIEGRADPILGKPTLNVGVLEGGTGANTVADKCTMKICRRLIGSENLDEEFNYISHLARSIDSDTEIETTFYGKPFLENSSCDLIKNLQNISRTNGLTGNLEVKQGWTEASLFTQYGQTVIFGPGHTSICHRPGEYVELPNLEIFSQIYQSLMQ